VRRMVILALLATLLGSPGCAYFNTFANAKRFFKKAERMQPDPQGKITVAARKKYDESIAKCQKLLELYPESDLVDDALFLMSRAYFNKSEFSRAERRLDELDERFPEHEFREQVLYMRGICHLESGDESRAIAVLDRLAKAYPESEHLAEGIYRSGEAEFRLGSWRSAIDAYGRLLDIFETSEWNDDARLKIAECWQELNQDTMAITTLTELAEMGNDRRSVFEGQLLQVEILIELHRYEEAHELMASLIETSANFQLRPTTLLLDAKIYESEDDLETTVTLLENIAKEFPKSIFAAEAWYRIGLIRQLHDRDFERALEAYEQVQVELPRSLFSDLARTKKQAILDFQSVQESFGEEVPDSSAAEIQFKLAENQWMRLENPESAIEEYGKVAEQFPGSSLAPRAIYAIAYIQRHSRADTAAALASVALLLENYPGSEAATFVKYWKRDLGGDAR
jgi:TolA-binding protein